MESTLIRGVTRTCIALAAAAFAFAPAYAQKSSLGKGEGFVDIVAWPGYIERGATKKECDRVTEFEKKTS